MEKLLETKNLYTEFHTFEGIVKALNGVSVMIKRGESFGLLGESGCGKSVTVRSMMRIVQSPGRIVDGNILLFFNEEHKHKAIDLTTQSELFMESMRGNDISMIFQEASSSLNPVFNIGFQVGESFYFHRQAAMLDETMERIADDLTKTTNPVLRVIKKIQYTLFRLEAGAYAEYENTKRALDKQLYHLDAHDSDSHKKKKKYIHARRKRLSKKHPLVSFINCIPFIRGYRKELDKTVKRHVIQLLTDLGIADPNNVIYRYPHELSGGMQQRIVIAIALACHPRLLIADEPTSNLDVTIQAQIIELIKTLKQSTISSVLFITHDLGLIAEVCDRVSVMYAGDVCETAIVEDLFENPLHPYSQGLLKAVPKVNQIDELVVIPGSVPNLVCPPPGCRFHPRCLRVMDICKKEKPRTIEYKKEHFVACHLYKDTKD